MRTTDSANLWLGFLAFLVLLGLCVHRTDAASADLTWTHPTARVDGTPLAVADIAATRLTWGKCSAALDQTTDVPAPATAHSIGSLGYGEWCFVARTVDKTGLVSDPTGPVQKIILAPPLPPTFVAVTVVVYDVRWNPGRGTVLNAAVGTVPRGTACGDSEITRQGQRRFREVPLDVVTLRTLPASAIVVAQCEVAS